MAVSEIKKTSTSRSAAAVRGYEHTDVTMHVATDSAITPSQNDVRHPHTAQCTISRFILMIPIEHGPTIEREAGCFNSTHYAV